MKTRLTNLNMINKSLKKNLSTILSEFLVIIAFSACAGSVKESNSNEIFNTSNDSKNIVSPQIQKTNESLIATNDQIDNTTLQIANITKEKLVLELLNKTDQTIYLFYSPPDVNNVKAEVYRYWFRCSERNKKEVDYNIITSHIIPSLEPLEKGKSFRFEISPLPKINANCKVSILYYNDEKIADLINNKSLDMNKSEQELVEEGKKSAGLQFQLNNE